MFYLVKTPWILRKLYPDCLWKVKTEEKWLYLTFDDGPHPEVTPFVLDELAKYQAKATFFCIGKNVKDHFDTYRRIIEEGHRPGNHTFDHLNGWKVSDKKYIENIRKASLSIDSDIFRPPYGRITRFQISLLQNEPFARKIVMWDVLSGDFDESLSGERCYENVINHSGPGSVIVFHDSLKALPRLQYALPKILEYFSREGYQFHRIPAE
jgi:peptidoglycan/xylan/chitin deacetylase (PgdA/CDA1 family)